MVDTRARNAHCNGCGRQGHFLFAFRADEILPNCPAFAKVPAAIRDRVKLAAEQTLRRRRAPPGGRVPAGVFAVDGAFDFLTPQITTDTEPGGPEHKSWPGSASPCVSSSSSSSASSGGTSVAGTGRGDDDEAAGQVAIGSPRSVSTSPAPASPVTEAPVTSAPAVSALKTPAASLVTEAPVTSAVEAATNAAVAAGNAAVEAKREDEATAKELEEADAQLALLTKKRQRLQEKKEQTARKIMRCSVAEQIAKDQAVIAERQANIEALKRQEAELGL
jgi:hypothetical protein